MNKPKWTRLSVGSLVELFQHEKEILVRIKDVPNGAGLFVVHPLRMLAYVGVELSEVAHAELLRLEPGLSALSSAAFDALSTSRERQRIRFQLKSLFRRPQ